jgi:hypothetical protein
MKTVIANVIRFIFSMIASLLMLMIAFNTPFSGLRSSFAPIHVGLIFVCAITSLLAPSRLTGTLVSAIFLPVLMLLWLANQRAVYYIDAASLAVLCGVAAASAKRITQSLKSSDH